MKRYLVIALAFIAGGAIGSSAPSTSAHSFPVSKVAPEVCQSNGTIVSVSERDSLLYVQCSSGIVQLVKK